MPRHRITDEHHDARLACRQVIIKAANEQRRRTNVALLNVTQATGRTLNLLPPFTSRSLQRAVCVVRQHGLVPADILTGAGFRAA